LIAAETTNGNEEEQGSGPEVTTAHALRRPIAKPVINGGRQVDVVLANDARDLVRTIYSKTTVAPLSE